MEKWFTCICTVAAILTLVTAPVHSGSPLPATKNNRFASNLQYTGGTGTGYTIEQVRWGDHHTFERIVLEFSPPTPDTSELPRMKVETEFYPMRMAIRLPGSKSTRQELFASQNIFQKSRMISGMDFFEDCGGGSHLSFTAARTVEFEVFTLTSPPRLVIDVMLSRMPPMREDVKYSLRTFPLLGDQVCLFLEEAANAGVTPRLIADADGNSFGELGLYDDMDEAFLAARRLRESLGKQFSLVVKTRGMMAVPAVVP